MDEEHMSGDNTRVGGATTSRRTLSSGPGDRIQLLNFCRVDGCVQYPSTARTGPREATCDMYPRCDRYHPGLVTGPPQCHPANFACRVACVGYTPSRSTAPAGSCVGRMRGTPFGCTSYLGRIHGAPSGRTMPQIRRDSRQGCTPTAAFLPCVGHEQQQNARATRGDLFCPGPSQPMPRPMPPGIRNPPPGYRPAGGRHCIRGRRSAEAGMHAATRGRGPCPGCTWTTAYARDRCMRQLRALGSARYPGRPEQTSAPPVFSDREDRDYYPSFSCTVHWPRRARASGDRRSVRPTLRHCMPKDKRPARATRRTHPGVAGSGA